LSFKSEGKIECQLCKYKALSSNPSTAKKEKINEGAKTFWNKDLGGRAYC
jgi:hypothetical protein